MTEADAPKADPPKCNRRWFQFSLRSLIVGVSVWTIVCALVPPVVREIRAARRQEATRFTPPKLAGGPRDLKNARPLTNEKITQLVFPPPEKESWFLELFH